MTTPPISAWRHRVHELGPPPALPNRLLRVLAVTDASAGEMWLALGGARSPHSYADIDYAIRWLAIPLRSEQAARPPSLLVTR